MSDLPDKLVGGPDDTDDGFAWVEEKFNPDDGMAVVTSEGGLCGNHPNRRYILEEMVQRYNAHEELEAELERLREGLRDIRNSSSQLQIRTMADNLLNGKDALADVVKDEIFTPPRQQRQKDLQDEMREYQRMEDALREMTERNNKLEAGVRRLREVWEAAKAVEESRPVGSDTLARLDQAVNKHKDILDDGGN